MFASWWLFIMILTSFYTANLTAFLTLSRFTLPIHSVEDIANPVYRWTALEGDVIEYSVKVKIKTVTREIVTYLLIYNICTLLEVKVKFLYARKTMI